MWKDSETNEDLLGFDYLVEATKRIIKDETLSPCSIGIYGDWGSGKSSLVSMALKDLEKEDDYLCIKFNGWLFEDYEDAKTALIGSILDEIRNKKGPIGKAEEYLKGLYKKLDIFKLAGKATKIGVDYFLTGGIGTLAELTFNSVLDKTKEFGGNLTNEEIKEGYETLFKKNSEVRDNLKSFYDDFENLLHESKVKKLVVFIDELDRCNHDTILETLEAIRLFLFTKGTAFILGADERQVMYAVRKRFPEIKGNQIDIGKEYLEKMIQYPIKIPQLGKDEVNYYINCLFLQYYFPTLSVNFINYISEKKNQNFLDFEITYELINDEFGEQISIDDNSDKLKSAISISKQISSVLSENLNGNPRHCKRFLNSLSMRMQMADFKGEKLDLRILAKLMLAEYFKESIFKLIGEMQSLEKGKATEIESIENDKWDEVFKLNIWKDDQWFKNWINTEPKLSKIDLRPYYYFSRESLQNITFKSSKSLSTEADIVLNNLLNGSEIQISNAIKNSTNISQFESSEILTQLISRIEESSNGLEYKKVKVILDWATTKPILFSEALNFLNRQSGKHLKTANLIRIENFGKNIGKIDEINELIDKWKKENPNLKSGVVK